MSPYRTAPPAPRRFSLHHLRRVVRAWGHLEECDEGIPAEVPRAVRLARRRQHALLRDCGVDGCPYERRT